MTEGGIKSATSRFKPSRLAATQAVSLRREAPSAWWRQAKGRLAIASGALVALAYLVSVLAPGWHDPLFITASLIAAAPVARRAIVSALAGAPFTIEMLMTIAVAGALVIGAAEEAAIVVFLFCVGEVLEGVAAEKARSGIRSLAALVVFRVVSYSTFRSRCVGHLRRDTERRIWQT